MQWFLTNSFLRSLSKIKKRDFQNDKVFVVFFVKLSVWYIKFFLIEIGVTCHQIHPFKVYNLVVFSIFIKLYNYHHLKPRTFSSSPQKTVSSSSHSPFPPFSYPWEQRIYFLLLWICLFWIHHINKLYNIQSFGFGFFQPRILWRFIHVNRMLQDLIPFYEWIIFHCINILHLIYPLISWQIIGLFSLFGYYE